MNDGERRVHKDLRSNFLPYGAHFPLIFSSAHVMRHMQTELHDACSDETRAALPALRVGCFWFEKRSITVPPAQIGSA